jgi:hypothetical protein
MEPERTWGALSLIEKDDFIRAYYQQRVPFEFVTHLIQRLNLGIERNRIPMFLPPLQAGDVCEMCGAAVERRALSRQESQDLGLDLTPGNVYPSECLVIWLTGVSTGIPYGSRTNQCSRCRHYPGQGANCPCQICQKHYREVARAKSAARARQHQEADEERRLADRVARWWRWERRAQMESIAGRLPMRPDALQDVSERAAALVRQFGRVEDDGGLWLRLTSDAGAGWEHETYDLATVLAVLQAQGIMRFSAGGEHSNADWRMRNGLHVLVTIPPGNVLSSYLVDERTRRKWEAIRAKPPAPPASS